MIESAPELMQAGDLINALRLAGIFLAYMVPVAGSALFIAALVNKKKKNRRKKNAEKLQKEQIKKDIAEQGKVTQEMNKGKVPKALTEMTVDDVDDILDLADRPRHGTADSLYLEFDKEGHIKNEKESG